MKKLILLMCCVLFVTGCITTSVKKAPVRALSSDSAKTTHTVIKGDTLYSVAFRYGWDYRDLATLNHIEAPYEIRLGQVIRLIPGKAHQSKVVVAQVRAKPEQNKVVTQVASTQPLPSVDTSNDPSVFDDRHKRWHWPVRGKLLSRFQEGQTATKGIDIAGSRGVPVHAAAEGEVVYAGSGLRGFGELIIIKHDNDYLSAYAHNEKILVKEGARVKVGQRIAEMGDSGADRVKLHFEIRKQGKPVDPLRYLPATF